MNEYCHYPAFTEWHAPPRWRLRTVTCTALHKKEALVFSKNCHKSNVMLFGMNSLVELMPIGLPSFPLKFLGQHWCKLHEQFCGLSLQVLSIWRIVLLSIICLFISLWREYSVLSLAVLGVDLKPLTEVGVWSCSNIQNPVFQSLHAFRLASCTITCLLLNKSEATPHCSER